MKIQLQPAHPYRQTNRLSILKVLAGQLDHGASAALGALGKDSIHHRRGGRQVRIKGGYCVGRESDAQKCESNFHDLAPDPPTPATLCILCSVLRQ